MNIPSNFQLSHPQESAAARVESGGQPLSSGEPAASSAVVDGDQTHISQASVLVAASSRQPEVRAEKVAAIQQSLATGAYAVSPSDVAGKLIDHLLR